MDDLGVPLFLETPIILWNHPGKRLEPKTGAGWKIISEPFQLGDF